MLRSKRACTKGRARPPSCCSAYVCYLPPADTSYHPQPTQRLPPADCRFSGDPTTVCTRADGRTDAPQRVLYRAAALSHIRDVGPQVATVIILAIVVFGARRARIISGVARAWVVDNKNSNNLSKTMCFRGLLNKYNSVLSIQSTHPCCY